MIMHQILQLFTVCTVCTFVIYFIYFPYLMCSKPLRWYVFAINKCDAILVIIPPFNAIQNYTFYKDIFVNKTHKKIFPLLPKVFLWVFFFGLPKIWISLHWFRFCNFYWLFFFSVFSFGFSWTILKLVVFNASTQ